MSRSKIAIVVLLLLLSTSTCSLLYHQARWEPHYVYQTSDALLFVGVPFLRREKVSGTVRSLFNEETSTTNADGDTTSYTYDGDGNVLTESDGLGHTTSYS